MRPEELRVGDLKESTHDGLLRCCKRRLRDAHGWPGAEKRWGIPCVWSRERPVYPTSCGSVSLKGPDLKGGPMRRLDCAQGFGSATFVTGAFGFAVTARLLNGLLGVDPLPTPLMNGTNSSR